MAPSDAEILSSVIDAFRELTAEVDVERIAADTMLRNVGVRSINVIVTLAKLQERFGLGDEVFREAMSDGVPFDEHTLGDLARYIGEALKRHGS